VVILRSTAKTASATATTAKQQQQDNSSDDKTPMTVISIYNKRNN